MRSSSFFSWIVNFGFLFPVNWIFAQKNSLETKSFNDLSFAEVIFLDSKKLEDTQLIIHHNSIIQTSVGKLMVFIMLAVLIIFLINLLITKRRQISLLNKLNQELILGEKKHQMSESRIQSQNAIIKDLRRKHTELLQLNATSYNLLTEIISGDNFLQSKSTGVNWNDILLKIAIQNIVLTKKLEGNIYVLKSENISLEKTIKDLLALMFPLMENEILTLEIGQEVEKSIKTDVYLLRLVLLNLLVNSFQYSEIKNPPQIKIEKINTEQIQIQVIDFGKGIPKKHHKSIFRKFFRLHGNSISGKGSSGLGLYFCAMALKTLGGEIKVRSKEGEGAVFFVTLPLI